MAKEATIAPDEWHQNLAEIAALPPRERYETLYLLHQATAIKYIDAVKSVKKEEAQQIGSDGRTKAVIVAHIMAWEEWQTQVFGARDKEERVKEQMQLRRFYDSEREKFVDFKSVDGFNAYQEEKYRTWPWQNIQQKAINTARKLQSFFPESPEKGWIDFLNSTQEYNWDITPDITIKTQAGWYLWMVSLEHEAFEHAADLY